MDLKQNVALRDYSTMRLGNGRVAYLAEMHSRQDVEQAVAWAVQQQLPPIMIGGGSNIFWRDEDFDGLLLVNKILGYEDFAEDDSNHYITVGSGENWDLVVERSVSAGLTGIEALSLIPGTAGATPIQNVGAYGQEIADSLVSIEAYDLHLGQFLTIPAADCSFGYRTSRFKTVDRSRFLITGLTLHLLHTSPAPPFYKALEDYFASHNIHEFTPQTIRDAVIDIRSHKLADPAKVANNGSFFANPIIDGGALVQLQADYPAVPYWPAGGGRVKIPAAWLLEQTGFKGIRDTETGMATWATQPLILVNEHARSAADLLKFKQKIVDAVQAQFGITLTQEPELLP